MKKQSINKFLYRVLCGFFLGVSIIAPGVSGSVMAIMMGIYDEMINIISNPFKNFRKNFIYLFPIGIGAALSLVIFIQILELLFEKFPIPAFLLFIGLIAGSLPSVFEEANNGVLKKRHVVTIISAIAFTIAAGTLAKSETSISVDTTNIYYYSFCGFIAGISSMIPGMSTSVVLMMSGVYTPLLKAVSNFEVLTMFPVGICFVIGMVLFSRLIKFIFRRYHNFAYYMVFGFMIGSIINVFPGLPRGALNWILSIIAITIGLYISFLFQKLGKKFNSPSLLTKG